ncbi:type I toxin-antitoxin system Fst family toxin [Enterococcus sp. LJL98]
MPLRGGAVLENLISLVIAPLFVGLVIVLVDHWLDD